MGAASASGTSGGSAAGGGAAAAGGSAGGSVDASTDADGSMDGDGGALDGGNGNCVDIHVLPSMLPEPEKWYGVGPPIGVGGDRDHVWRDANGLHVAWNAYHVDDGNAEMIVSSFDPATGAVLKHRFFPHGGRKVVNSTGVGPDNTVGLAVGWVPPNGGATELALLVISTSDSSENLYPLAPWPDPGYHHPVGIGWDGEAFAVHAFGEGNVQYVTRIQPDGTVLLPPTAFGKAAGYISEIRYATDPESGTTVAVSGFLADFPWLTGHLRNGTPLPDPAKIQGVQLQPQNWQGGAGWGGALTRPAIVAVPGGAAVAWSSTAGLPVSTFIQEINSSLAPNADVISISGEPLPPPALPDFYDGNEWLTVQPRSGGGWWVAGTNSIAINEFVVDGSGNSTRRPLVTFSRAPQWGFAVTDFESARWNDELWLAFQDRSSSVVQPFRVIRVHPECTYASMYDLIGK